MLVFIAWHVVWALTGLKSPSPSDHEGNTRVLLQISQMAVIGMVVVGVLLPLALHQPWGRRIPSWILLWAAWTGCVLLSVRGLAGIVDGLVRATGLLPKGLGNLTTAQVFGSEHPSWWAVFSSSATDVLFAVGGVAFGLAATRFQRAHATSAPVAASNLGKEGRPLEDQEPCGRGKREI
ncbi:MAG: DUF3995 domain-containing protein [Streptosporangiaceae bacterium]